MASALKHVRGAVTFFVFLCGYCCVNGAPVVTAPKMDTPPLLPYGLNHGDSKMGDLSSNLELDLPANISYFGSVYEKLYISADGLVSFQDGMRYYESIVWKEGTRNERTDKPFIAPFIYDGYQAFNIDPSTYQGGIYYRVMDAAKLDKGSQFYDEQYMALRWLNSHVKEAILNAPDDFEADFVVVVTWDRIIASIAGDAMVQTCNTDPDKCESATFQLLLVVDKTYERTIAILNYHEINIKLQPSYQAGFNGGFGREWYNVIPCHGKCDVDFSKYIGRLPELKGSNFVGQYILDVTGEIIIRGGCMPDEFTSGVLEIFPNEVGMYGGEKLEVSANCRPMSTPIYCRFGKDTVVEGIMVNSMKGVCPVPPLTVKGEVLVGWSDVKDTLTWNEERNITVLLPGRTQKPVAIPSSVMDGWLSRDAATITVPWDPLKFSLNPGNARVNIRLIGYRETDTTVEYKHLETIGSAEISAGTYTFKVADHRCTHNCNDFSMGLLEVAMGPEYLSTANTRVAVRHGEMTLGWYVNDALTQENGTDWSDDKCRAWADDDSQHKEWLSHLLPCPCTVDQALSDFGRFQPDPGCNLFTGSKCSYHQGAKHCVRSIVPTIEGSGNQCCYNSNGNLLYSQLSYQGSTPDRSHSWGAPPYGKPDFVPSLSHWKHDVVSFYYCCLWNNYDLCDFYMERRPTADCKNYDVPALATVRGSTAITTFDGQEYHMGGNGDFYLVTAKQIVIQGRFGPRRGGWDLGTLSGSPTPWSPPSLQAVGIRVGPVVIDIHQAPELAVTHRGLDIQVEGNRRFFVTPSSMWQDFKGGVSITNNALPDEENLHNNFTILTSDNIGVNVYTDNGLLHLTVALPPTMKMTSQNYKGMGLLGTYDLDGGNDFTTKDGRIIAPGTDYDSFMQNFILPWDVDKSSNIFHYPKTTAPFDAAHSYGSYNEIPHSFATSPSDDQIKQVCDNSPDCKWDYRITGSAEVANTTREAAELFDYLQYAATPSDNCGLPSVGRMAIMDRYNFSTGSTVTVTGCRKGMNFAGSMTYKCVRETRSEAEQFSRADYGLVKVDPTDGMEYLIHWVPRPIERCTKSTSTPVELSIEVIIGIVIGAVAVLVILFLGGCLVHRRKKGRSDKYSSSSRDQASTGGGRSRNLDDKSDNAMLPREGERRPIYKASGDPVQVGTNV